MKQQWKRSFAVLLAVLMLLSVVPFTGLAATTSCPQCRQMTATKETVPPTCTEAGYEKIVCSNPSCKYESKSAATAPATGHKWVDTVVADANRKSEANCQSPAVYYKTCSVCGISAKNETNADALTFTSGDKNPDEHPADKATVLSEGETPTCANRYMTPTISCSACGQTTYSKMHDPLPHTQKTPANCVDQAICDVCGQSYGNVVPTNHKHIVTVSGTPSTCIEQGYTDGKKCDACGTVIEAQEKLPLAAHTPTTRNVPATCTEDGVQNEIYCMVCNEVQTPGTRLDKLGHDFGKWAYKDAGSNCTTGGTIVRTCKRTGCGFQETRVMAANQHVIVEDPAKAPTCTEAGLKKGSHCDICATVTETQEVDPALGHLFTGEVKANNDGTHSFKCIRCDEIGGTVNCVDVNKDCVCDLCGAQLQHTFTNYVPDGNATCLADGTKTAKCDVCGVAIDQVADVDSHLTAEHAYVYENQNDATCVTNAHEIGTCSVCGQKSEPREIENTALGHDVVADWKYPEGFDCAVGGYRYKDCNRCKEVIEQENVVAAEHTVVTDPAVAVTCTEDGKTEGSHCAVCGKIFDAQAVIPAQGHQANDAGFTVLTAATCETDGEESAVCAVCGKTFTQVIPATGHKYVTTVVAPKCTTQGYTNHKCSVCGKEYNDTFVKATGHNWKITVKQATLKKDGSKIYVCTVCRTKVTKVIAKIASVTLSETTIAKDGKKHTPTVIVTNSDGKTLKKGTAYTVKYSAGRKIIGTYTVTVTFIGNYSGTKVLKFKIVPAAPKTVKAVAGSKSATITWSKVSGGDKYIVYYATAKNGTYKKAGTTTKTSATIKNLKSGATYYFKVKAVRVLDEGNLNGIASAAAKAKIK